MQTEYSKIITMISELKTIHCKYRIKDTDLYIGGSEWNDWINVWSEEVLDFGYSPQSYHNIQEIHINPIEEKKIGKLIPSKLINNTDKICGILEKLKINYEIIDLIITIK